MTPENVLARLVAHWPSLGGDANDVAAVARMQDWLRIIRQSPHAVEVADQIVTGWAKDRPPKIGDWQETARQVAQRRHLETPRAIAAPSERIDPARVREILAPARAKLVGAPRNWRNRTGAV